jgi:cardiolipin synthase
MFELVWQQVLSIVAVLDVLVILAAVPWILTIKKEPTPAVAWVLVVLLVPLVGFFLFLWFGYNYVDRPLRRKRRHRAGFRSRNPAHGPLARKESKDGTYQKLGSLATRLGGFPVSEGNEVTLYHDTNAAYRELLEAIEHARHHIHAEFFIIQPDETGTQFTQLLSRKAAEGVQVRLLYDAIGSLWLKGRLLRPIHKAKGRCCAFLPINPFQRRVQFNLRNHRKIVVVDGRIGFTGGMNIGNEYLGQDPRFGYWRDNFLRLEGPAVAALQRIFSEDWDFASMETLKGSAYFPDLAPIGPAVVQVVESGPDQHVNSNRELIYAAISSARHKLWIATPYFVPDSGILDALRLAVRLGADVRVLLPQKPDHWLPHFAAAYYMSDLLPEGLQVYHYSKGMMHTKMMMVDGRWGFMGTTNLDNRSLHLNFELNIVLHTPDLVAELEQAFLEDLRESILIEPRAFAGRPFATRLIENGCRLFSPVL